VGKVDSPAQIEAFEDTWHPGEAANRAFEEVAIHGSDDTARLLKAMVDALGHNDVTAYLSMMAVRLIELHRVLKPTGSIYLHCDPTASAYLKVLMDSIFKPHNFRNEIVWKRTSGHSDTGRYGRVHDTLLYYVRSDNAVWNQRFQAYDDEYVLQYYRYQDPDGRKWMSGDASAGGLSGGGYDYEWKGVRRVWRFPPETMQRLDGEGRIFYTRNGIARVKRYLDESRGLPIQDVWSDVEAVRSWHAELLGYPTQKPLGLLERIIEDSSNEGALVLDPFCGCGTAVHAAQKLNRNWIGIDITNLAINLIRRRMEDAFPELKDKIRVVGEPVDLPGAQELADRDKYQFQWWALDRIGAAPAGGDKKKGMDRGIDGIIPFMEGVADRRRVIISVKGGAITSALTCVT
jgi:adenine specific DNA methylase Mod